MSEPDLVSPDEERKLWRLRRAKLVQILLPACVCFFAGLVNCFRRHAPLMELAVYIASMVLVALSTASLLAIAERRRRPPVLRFWDDGSGYRLTVRHKGSHEVVLQEKAESLAGRDFRCASWARVDLTQVNLEGADLRAADLRSAELRGAYLCQADLRSAQLTGAQLAGARVAGARFKGADLRGADFRGRGTGQVLWDHDLWQADFHGAIYNAATRWPRGVDPTQLGCVLSDEGTEVLPIPHTDDPAAVQLLPLPSEEATFRR